MDHTRLFVEATMTSWLYWLGFVEIGTHEAQDLVFRLTDLGRELLFGERALPGEHNEALHASSVWVVQPNYDVVVYLDAVTPAQLAFLEGHAERRQAEAHTAHYQLTRDSVYRGLEGGTTVEEFLAILCQGAQMALPQNVEREIRDWASQREQLTIHKHVRIIAFSSAETRARAMAAGLSGTLIGEAFVLLAAGVESDAALRTVAGTEPIPHLDYAQPPVKCLQVSEDGTLTLSEDTGDLLVRPQITRFAELVGKMQWRITPAVLSSARHAGVTAAVLLSFLQSRAHGIVPPLLEVFIRNMLGTYDVVQGETVFALRITDKKLYMAITTSPALQPFMLDVPGPDTILIYPGKQEAFLTNLDELGIKLTAYTPAGQRPDWQQTLRDANTQQRRRGW